MLAKDKYKEVVEHTQLVALDLIILDKDNKVLLGKRTNEPAKGFYFVPGSKTFKNNNLNDELKRISLDELGIEINHDEVRKIGIYEHYYENNYFNDDFSTHYIVFPCVYNVNDEDKEIINETMLGQHDDVIWLEAKDIIGNDLVHKFTKKYFEDNPDNKFL